LNCEFGFGLVGVLLGLEGGARQPDPDGKASLKREVVREAKRKVKKTKLRKRNQDSSRFWIFRVDGRLRWVAFFLDK
jgi:hypothetical protein